ncbi:protein downstream neighbor of Son [Striga asiatica]|uniref:Protein downstream neighbor of Son n=1 Tax=Striga asiatica TaxID=4170 RepID=A0A5A7P316_STRAF|nr:protein downstream neighbor of Son [Striga asiatica]
MTKVAVAAQLPASNDLHFGGVAGGGGASKISTTTLKRKTPSELRGELLKLKNPVEFADESPSIPSFTRNADGAVSGASKSDSSKIPRFIRMDEHFPVTKISRLLPRKGTSKDDLPSKCVNNMKHSSFPVELDEKQGQNLCVDNVDSEGGKHSSNQNNNSTGKCIHNTFRSVKELSLGGEKLNGSSFVDMGKALRGLVSCESRAVSAPLPESIDRTGNIVSHSFCSEIHISGPKIPLDLTLKTSMRLQSSIPVIWFHRLINVTTKSRGLFSNVGYQIPGVTCLSEPTSTSQSGSWMYPQSTLPQAAISALASAPGGKTDFLSKRQQAWEDSFRSLYYMLRKKICKLFYVCCPLFVVMFTAYDGASKIRSSCYAYVSQSTRNLRSLLKEHDVSFSMPLCSSKLEEVTAEDIVELSHIEKHNLGQTRAIESLIGVDNTPQSLLMFSGNKNVHALYDFLLNYRSFLTSLNGGDVPVLYSPVPFENAALSTPEVRCKQVRRIDYLSSRLKNSNTDSEPKSSGSGICYSVEIKDAYLPPWVISGICNAMLSNGGDFEASFSTESTTNGLNVGLDVIIKDHQSSHLAAFDEQLRENDNSFSIPNTTVSFQRNSGFMKGLKYGDGYYTAFLSPIE